MGRPFSITDYRILEKLSLQCIVKHRDRPKDHECEFSEQIERIRKICFDGDHMKMREQIDLFKWLDSLGRLQQV